MTILTEGARTAEFLLSEANDWRSRDAAVVTVPANTTFEAGTVLGQLAADDSFVRHDTDGTDDGRRTEAGVLYANLINETGSAVDVDATVIIRDAEVNSNSIIYEAGADANAITASNAALAALGIIVR